MPNSINQQFLLLCIYFTFTVTFTFTLHILYLFKRISNTELPEAVIFQDRGIPLVDFCPGIE